LWNLRLLQSVCGGGFDNQKRPSGVALCYRPASLLPHADFCRVTDYPEVVPGEKSASGPRSPFMRTQLTSCRLPKADSALLRSSLFHHLCRFVSFSSGGSASARESLSRGLGSRWFTEGFNRNALVTDFQHGQVFCAAGRFENYAVTRCRLHQRAPQR